MRILNSRAFAAMAIFALALLVFAPAVAQPEPPSAKPQEDPATSVELTSLVRTLRATKTLSAYAALKRFAERNAAAPLGTRAALALGHYDYAANRAESAAAWLRIAAKDALLADYAAFWHAQVERSSGRAPAALVRFEELRAAYPRSTLAAEIREATALTALLAGQPEKTVELLAGDRAARPDLLLARAQAYEKLGSLARAAADYNSIYYLHPLTPEASISAPRITALRARLGAEFPAVPAADVRARVQSYISDRRCGDARNELKRLGPVLPAAHRDVLAVRVAVCMKRGTAPPAALAKLQVSDPEANAERLYLLSQLYRSKRDEPRMLAAIEELALRHPASQWNQRALFQAGNYFWTQFDYARAGLYYQRLYQAFPESEDAHAAHWRMAWQAYIEGSPAARPRMEEHLRLFRGSSHSANALYWLARLAEKANERAQARGFYVKAVQRFPQTYYGRIAADRLRELGGSETAAPEILASIPDAVAPLSLKTALDADTQQRLDRAQARAQALAALGLDAYAERELTTAFQETRAAQLLLAAAQLAHDGNRFYNGILLGRRLVPQLESRRLPELPEEVWRTVYPFVYGESIQATAEMAGLDPMLVAGLIRQESVFQAQAVSRAGAIGLMQVMPPTGRQLARQLRLSYAKKKLFQPEFNLRLGTVHLARLVRQYDSVEAALAAYNAGESRVAQWRAGRTFSEPAEFVESIPFTETREYVQIVLRNREIYRSLYGQPASAAAASAPAQ